MGCLQRCYLTPNKTFSVIQELIFNFSIFFSKTDDNYIFMETAINFENHDDRQQS